MDFKKIIMIVSVVIITALLGGYFLSFFSDVKTEENDATNTDEVMDYTKMVESNSQETENKEELEENNETEEETNEEEINEEEIIEKVQKMEKKLKEETDEDFSHEYEGGITIQEQYKKKYGEKIVNKAVQQTYEVLYLLTDASVLNRSVREKWDELATDDFLKKIDRREIEDYSFKGYITADVVPVESDYDGIAVGLFVTQKYGVALFELDFKPEKDKVLLDDLKMVWSK